MENSLIQAYANRDPRQQPQRLLPATILARFCEQAVLETIESGARDIVEAIEESDVARAFNHLAAVHFLLIDESCAAVDFVLSSSDRGRALAELLARSFLVIAMAMLRQLHDTDATAAARAAFCTTSREICCCLSTALPPPFHWVLDEVLCLLPHAASAEAVSPHYLRDMSFEGDFHVELQEIYHHFVHFHCAGRCAPRALTTLFPPPLTHTPPTGLDCPLAQLRQVWQVHRARDRVVERRQTRVSGPRHGRRRAVGRPHHGDRRGGQDPERGDDQGGEAGSRGGHPALRRRRPGHRGGGGWGRQRGPGVPASCTGRALPPRPPLGPHGPRLLDTPNAPCRRRSPSRDPL